MGAPSGWCITGKMVLLGVRDTAMTLACALYVKDKLIDKSGKNEGSAPSAGGRNIGAAP